MPTPTVYNNKYVKAVNPGGGFQPLACDGVTNDTAALRALIPWIPPQIWLWLEGPVWLGNGLGDGYGVDFRTGVKTSAHVDHVWVFGNGNTTISGNVPGMLFGYNRDGVDASCDVRLWGLNFQNGSNDPNASSLYLDRIEDGRITDCRFPAAQAGCVIGRQQRTNLAVRLARCHFPGNLTSFPAGVGLAARMLGRVRDCEFTQWQTAARLSNHVTVDGYRCEECHIGFEFGHDPSGSDYSTYGVLRDGTNESTNYTAIARKGCTMLKVAESQAHGTGNGVAGFTGGPYYGVKVEGGSCNFKMEDSDFIGSYANAGVDLTGALTATLENARAAGTGANWIAPSLGAGVVRKVNSNCPFGS